jgi:hypothetical protein
MKCAQHKKSQDGGWQECLPTKSEALSSNPSAAKKKKKIHRTGVLSTALPSFRGPCPHGLASAIRPVKWPQIRHIPFQSYISALGPSVSRCSEHCRFFLGGEEPWGKVTENWVFAPTEGVRHPSGDSSPPSETRWETKSGMPRLGKWLGPATSKWQTGRHRPAGLTAGS